MESNLETIESLIQEATDPMQRAMLLVLGRIDTALSAQTHAVESIARSFDAHRTEFTEHRQEEERLLASIKGGWRSASAIGSVVFVAILGLAGYIFNDHVRANQSDSDRVAGLVVRVAAMEAQVGILMRALEKKP